ncbi:MAG: hypothetical protein NTX53_05600 [candidate division WOR-3 bacterium]|nr:hypothetical protein [candidate division WOR-3 bacterium]
MSLDKLVGGAVTGYCDLRRRGVEATIDEYVAEFPEKLQSRLRRALEIVVVMDDLARKARKANIRLGSLLEPLNLKERLEEKLDVQRREVNRPDSFAPYLESVKLCGLFRAPEESDAEERREWARQLTAGAKKKPARPKTVAKRRRKK